MASTWMGIWISILRKETGPKSDWLGEGTQFIRNKAGDPVFLSKDGLRKVRFDFNRPAPHENSHLHLEHLVDGEWQEISRVYPIDVPHK